MSAMVVTKITESLKRTKELWNGKERNETTFLIVKFIFSFVSLYSLCPKVEIVIFSLSQRYTYFFSIIYDIFVIIQLFLVEISTFKKFTDPMLQIVHSIHVHIIFRKEITADLPSQVKY